MPSKNAIGIAPLVLGSVQLWNALLGFLVGPSARATPTYGLLAQLLGSLAAIGVGVGILLGWGSFDIEDQRETGSALVALLAIAALGFVGGVFSILFG